MMTWKKYEEVVKAIYEALGAQYGVIIEGYGHSCKRRGSSSAQHQIDVLTSHTDGAHKYFTVIECKNWNKKVQKGVISKVAYITKDCNFDKAIVVSSKGYTPDAVKVAKDLNVHLVELLEHNIFIQNDILTKFYINKELEETKLNSIECVLNYSEKEYFQSINLQNKNWSEFKLLKRNREVIMLMDVLTHYHNQILDTANTFELQTKSIKFDQATKLKIPHIKRTFLIDGINLSGYKTACTQLDPDYFHNKVWLLMKLIFERKNLVFTVDGQVVPEQLGEPITLMVGQRAKISLKPIVRQFKIKANPILNTK